MVEYHVCTFRDNPYLYATLPSPTYSRAELAGQQIKEHLKKLHMDGQVYCVDAIPRVLIILHEMPGETGISPYEFFYLGGNNFYIV